MKKKNDDFEPILVTPAQAAYKLGIGLNTLRKELKYPDTFIVFVKVGRDYRIDINATIDNLRRKGHYYSYVKRSD